MGAWRLLMFLWRQSLFFWSRTPSFWLLTNFYFLSTFGLQLFFVDFSAEHFCCIAFSIFEKIFVSFPYCSRALKVMWHWFNFSAAVFPIKNHFTQQNFEDPDLTWAANSQTKCLYSYQQGTPLLLTERRVRISLLQLLESIYLKEVHVQERTFVQYFHDLSINIV